MSSSIKLIIITLLSALFLLQGCSKGGGGTSNIDGGSTQNGLFSIRFTDKNIDVFDYKLSIKRGDTELTDTLLKYISYKKESDGSIVITFKQVTANGTTDGLTSLKVGDVITLEAKGYTPQQFVVDANMLSNASNEISLKAIGSRQTFNLSDLTAGSGSVTPKSARGARTIVTEDSVTFETLDSGISLSMPKVTYDRLVRKISRLPRSGPNTKVYIDMTSIDPRTEHDATIGDFSYDPSVEPENERSTNAASTNSDTGLSSVVMADMKMTTDAGDEIHCFNGEYDPATNTCSGDATATLKMKIPESQFNQYADKYNDGDRVIPLYSYSQVKATWVRQVRDGKGVDAELVLTDNNSNQKADDGDVLTLVGQVGHFSWWNGDYPIQNTCLDVPLDLSKAPFGVSKVRVSGVDYAGRVKSRYVEDNATLVENISAQKNSIVSIELIMKDGSVGDSTTYTTGPGDTGSCEIVGETLVAPAMNSHKVGVVVKDTQGNVLKGATLRSAGEYNYTDTNGTAEFTYAYAKDANLSETISVSYYSNDGVSASSQKEITQNDSNITFTLDVETSTFKGKVTENINGKVTVAAGAYVKIYNYDPYYYKSVVTDANGSFEIKLPKSMTDQDSTASIYIRKYNSEYAFYPRYSEEITLTPDLGTFALAFTTHTVSGQVSDTEGKSIASATVYTSGDVYKYARADEDGNYNFIIFGDADKNATLQAYTYKDGYRYSEKESFITQKNGKTNQDLTIDLRKAVIKGRVLTSNGIALSNMRVYWSRDYWNYVKTDVNGSFSLETYNGGDGKIRVYNPSSYEYLDFNANTNIRDVEVKNVQVGNIYDLENLLSVPANFAPIISSVTINPNTPIADVPFEVKIDAYDPDDDTITYKVEQYYGSGATISQSHNIATVTADKSGYYYFKVTVTDSNSNSASSRVSVYVKNHVRPVIDSVSYVLPNNKRYFDKSAPLNVEVVAHSDEGNALTYAYSLESLNSSVVDVALDDSDSNVTIPTTVANGRYRFVVTVSDVYNKTTTRRYFTIDDTVAPEIDTLLINNSSKYTVSSKQNKSISFDVNLTDADHVSDASWYWYINGKTFSTQKIDPITFTNEGYYYGYVTVRDTKGRYDSRSFYINVQADAKPVIDSVSVTPTIITRLTDGTYVDGNNNAVSDLLLKVKAHDDDSTSLTYTFGTLGDNSATVSENNATFSLADLSVGRHSVKVTVKDATTTVTRYVNIEVLKDTPPVITEFRVPLKTKVSTTVKLYANATDANGQSVTYKWSATAGTITNITSKNASLDVSSIAKDINVTLEVSDGQNKVTRVRTLKVLKNVAPEVSYFSLRTPSVIAYDGESDQNIDVKSIYGDVDGSIKSAKYIVIDESNATVFEEEITQSNVLTTLSLNLENPGNYKVYLEVKDDNNATTQSQKANLSVTKANSAPVITALTATSTNLLLTEKTVLNLAVSDADGDNISVSWSASGGAVVKDAKAQDKATFSASEVGTYTVTAVATDTAGLKAIKTLDIKVQSANLGISSDKTEYILGSDVTLTASMSDDHTVPSATSWSIVSKPDASTLATTATGASVVLTPDVVGTYKVKADTTINGVSFSAEYSFNVKEESTSKADLEGTVTSDSGDVLSGAKVRLYNKADSSIYDVTVTTDSSGAYSFSDVVAGSYYLVVYAGNGYVSQTQIVEIK